nr:pentatricopeptide repeat-containing protein At4g19890-like [Coffea arabica]
MSSASSHLRHGYEVEWPQRLCSCGRVCDIKIVEKSEKNLGRYYYACPKESAIYSGNEGESSTANLMSPKSTNGHRGAETELERVSMDVARLKVCFFPFLILLSSSFILNCVLGVAVEMGCDEVAEDVFDEMSEREGCPNACTFETMVVGYCRMAQSSGMLDRGCLVDNATCTLITSVFCEKGYVSRALWIFNKLVDVGFSPNLINFTSLINGLCKRGSIRQAFEFLEEMVRKGWKPNVYTHSILVTLVNKSTVGSNKPIMQMSLTSSAWLSVLFLCCMEFPDSHWI